MLHCDLCSKDSESLEDEMRWCGRHQIVVININKLTLWNICKQVIKKQQYKYFINPSKPAQIAWMGVILSLYLLQVSGNVGMR